MSTPCPGRERMLAHMHIHMDMCIGARIGTRIECAAAWRREVRSRDIGAKPCGSRKGKAQGREPPGETRFSICFTWLQ